MAAICLLAALIIAATIRFLPRRISLAGGPGTIFGIANLTKVLAHRFPRGLSQKDARTADRMVEDPMFWRKADDKIENALDEDRTTFVRHLHEDRQFPPSAMDQLPKLYQPPSLHAASRFLICFLLAAGIVTLEALLNMSMNN
ncbi:hypothetical protein F4801DRAFT_578842 [Xylaria longipes]|nr:hypothetical protein F4801DRAFT_578842 [Xylaria longipes]